MFSKLQKAKLTIGEMFKPIKQLNWPSSVFMPLVFFHIIFTDDLLYIYFISLNLIYFRFCVFDWLNDFRYSISIGLKFERKIAEKFATTGVRTSDCVGGA